MTSEKTNQEIQKILNKYLTSSKQEQLFTELSEVRGNKSFKDSISNLLKMIKVNRENRFVDL